MADWITRAALAADLRALGLAAGDLVMVHAACSRVGEVMGGPDAILGAIRDVVGSTGTVAAYLDWEAPWEDLADADGRVPTEWRAHVAPFDPAKTRAARGNGVMAETVRTTPGALRSGNPGASMAAIGARAAWLIAGHPLDYGYGPGSPLARLVEAGGRVLMLGAPLDTMTVLHLAEHLADLPGKRVIRTETPFAGPDGTVWRMIEEFDTGEPVVDALPENAFELIVEAYLANGRGRRGTVGAAPSVMVDAADMVRFGVAWLEGRVRQESVTPGLTRGPSCREPTA